MRRSLPLLVVAGVAAAGVAALGTTSRGTEPVAARAPVWHDFGWSPLAPGGDYLAAAMANRFVVVTTEGRPATFLVEPNGSRWSAAPPPPPFAGAELVGGPDRVALLPAEGDRVGLYDGSDAWQVAPAPGGGIERASVATWVDGDLVVIGRQRVAAYDVDTQRWRDLPPLLALADPIAAAARGGDLVAAVWTGDTGRPRTALRVLRPGAARWEEINAPPDAGFAVALASAADGFTGAWRGPRGILVAVGGPATWEVAGLAGGADAVQVLAGSRSRLVVWGGRAGGAVYHRRARLWRPLPDLPVDAAAQTAVWTGDRLLVLAETGADEPPRLYGLSLGT